MTADAVGTVAWTPTSALPPGLSVSGGMISGTPGVPGNYTFTMNASDGTGPVLSFTFSLHVSNLSILDPQVLTLTAVAGTPASYTFTASGAGSPTWSQSGLSTTLSFNSSGVLQTTATTPAGGFTFLVTACGGDSVTRRFTLYVLA